ncbi:hypothetical protein L208DRAFT_166693 [Tricholoma matsutake]|nr:hypothetical protein L208DRAFT_166693 [Tricholoma matsutake 945]
MTNHRVWLQLASLSGAAVCITRSRLLIQDRLEIKGLYGYQRICLSGLWGMGYCGPLGYNGHAIPRQTEQTRMESDWLTSTQRGLLTNQILYESL